MAAVPTVRPIWLVTAAFPSRCFIPCLQAVLRLEKGATHRVGDGTSAESSHEGCGRAPETNLYVLRFIIIILLIIFITESVCLFDFVGLSGTYNSMSLKACLKIRQIIFFSWICSPTDGELELSESCGSCFPIFNCFWPHKTLQKTFSFIQKPN